MAWEADRRLPVEIYGKQTLAGIGDKLRFTRVRLSEEMHISDLRNVPEHCDTLAERIWNAWWRSKGTRLHYIRERLDENLRSVGIPFTMVAHQNGLFIGTASVIESDMEERPDLSPWVAAVWVDPEYRDMGVGTALIAATKDCAGQFMSGPIYLCAKRSLAPFYERMGWRRIQEDVGGLDLYQHGI